MKLFLLMRKDYVGWDENGSMVVRASDEAAARIIANNSARDEGAIWTDPAIVTCEVLTKNGGAEVIMIDFHAA